MLLIVKRICYVRFGKIILPHYTSFELFAFSSEVIVNISISKTNVIKKSITNNAEEKRRVGKDNRTINVDVVKVKLIHH